MRKLALNIGELIRDRDNTGIRSCLLAEHGRDLGFGKLLAHTMPSWL